MIVFRNEIERIVDLLTGGPEFCHESVQMANIKLDQVTDAVVFAPSLGVGTITASGSGIRPKMKIMVEFLQLSDFEADLTTNQDIIDGMYDMAMEFIERLRQSTVFEGEPGKAVSEFQCAYIYERFDANFAGIALEFDAALRKGISPCVPTLSP